MKGPKVTVLHIAADWWVHWVEHSLSTAECSQGHICFCGWDKVGEEKALLWPRDPDLKKKTKMQLLYVKKLERPADLGVHKH